mmetsp:Transcript_18247/g.29982  ORF Transcript_18247/g.29982 Transcript_18247/m.29982 type:complete len:150 (-) Transcript_18247:714-1163(-)
MDLLPRRSTIKHVMVTLLCGPPGVGKSFLIRQLLRFLNDNTLSERVCAWLVDYDMIFDYFLSKEAHISTDRVELLRDSRKLATSYAKHILETLSGYDYSPKEDDCRAFDPCFPVPTAEDVRINHRHLVIIDDNMYYRSMRYQYYQLARS